MAALDQFGVMDVIVLVICILFLARGIWIGFVRQLATIVAVFVGYYVAAHYFKDIHELVMPFLDSREVAFVITYMILLLLIYVAGILLGVLLKKVMTITFLDWFDRALGGVFGLAKGFFISCLVFMAFSAFLSGTNNFLRQSISYPVMKASSEAILQAVRDKEVRSLFMAKEPAIGFDNLPPVERPSGEEVLPPVERTEPAPVVSGAK